MQLPGSVWAGFPGLPSEGRASPFNRAAFGSHGRTVCARSPASASKRTFPAVWVSWVCSPAFCGGNEPNEAPSVALAFGEPCVGAPSAGGPPLRSRAGRRGAGAARSRSSFQHSEAVRQGPSGARAPYLLLAFCRLEPSLLSRVPQPRSPSPTRPPRPTAAAVKATFLPPALGTSLLSAV